MPYNPKAPHRSKAGEPKLPPRVRARSGCRAKRDWCHSDRLPTLSTSTEPQMPYKPKAPHRSKAGEPKLPPARPRASKWLSREARLVPLGQIAHALNKYRAPDALQPEGAPPEPRPMNRSSPRASAREVAVARSATGATRTDCPRSQQVQSPRCPTNRRRPPRTKADEPKLPPRVRARSGCRAKRDWCHSDRLPTLSTSTEPQMPYKPKAPPQRHEAR